VRDAGPPPQRPIIACNRQGGAAPLEMRHLEESRRGQSTDTNSSNGNRRLPDHARAITLLSTDIQNAIEQVAGVLP
jgi:hypothetical protein